MPLLLLSCGPRKDATTTSSTFFSNTVRILSLQTIRASISYTQLRSMATSSKSSCFCTKTYP